MHNPLIRDSIFYTSYEVAKQHLLMYRSRMLTVRERRKAQALSEIRELVSDYGRTATSTLLEVHPDTVERWLTGQTTPTAAVLIALRAAAKGVLPTMKHDHWRGWRFANDGMLYGPHDKRGLYP